MYIISKSAILFAAAAAIILIANHPSSVFSQFTEPEENFDIDAFDKAFHNIEELEEGREFVEILEETLDKVNELKPSIAKCVAYKWAANALEELMNFMRCYKEGRKDTVECKHLQRRIDNIKREMKHENCEEVVNNINEDD
ncbi:uncharacterized protein LOC142597481 [Dermatophagoides farinae]|uniref:Secreted protein n=1 Tax=Dermatophagoides farinae TaxID=6954 RepID=A0A922IA85_DERFA|nr:hypothetical protein DERF_006382 [Dermatophagoides farinae]